VYGSARKSYLKILERVANQALKICRRAYCTSPVSSLEVLAHDLHSDFTENNCPYNIVPN